VSACIRCSDKVLAKHLMRDAGLPTRTSTPSNETAFRELGAAEALSAMEERLTFPIVVKPASQGRRSASSSPGRPAEVPRGARRRLLLRPQGAARAPRRGARPRRSRFVDGEPLPVVEAVPHDEDFYDFAARYTIGRTTSPARRSSATRRPRVCRRSPATCGSLFGCRGFARVDLMRDDETGDLYVLEVNSVPG